MSMLSQMELNSAQPSLTTLSPWVKYKRIMDIGEGEG